MLEQPLFRIVRLPSSKGEPVPSYLERLTLQEVFNYFFNWNVDAGSVPVETVKDWYAKARGWTWEQI